MSHTQVRPQKLRPIGPKNGRRDDRSTRQITLRRPSFAATRIGPPPRASDEMQVLSKQLADKAGNSQRVSWPMDALSRIVSTARAAVLGPFEEILDTTEVERQGIVEQMAPGASRLLRLPITAEQARTQIPNTTKSLAPEVRIGEAVANHPALSNIGEPLTRRTDLRSYSVGRLRLRRNTPHTRPPSWRKNRGPRMKPRSKGERMPMQFVSGGMESGSGAWQRHTWHKHSYGLTSHVGKQAPGKNSGDWERS